MKARFQKSVLSLALASLTGVSLVAMADSLGEPGRDSGKKANPLRNVYFGEQHLHTGNSPDAFVIGGRSTWDYAYNYAKGKEIKLSTTGQKMKKTTPYDSVGITDHSEYYGVMRIPNSRNSVPGIQNA